MPSSSSPARDGRGQQRQYQQPSGLHPSSLSSSSVLSAHRGGGGRRGWPSRDERAGNDKPGHGDDNEHDGHSDDDDHVKENAKSSSQQYGYRYRVQPNDKVDEGDDIDSNYDLEDDEFVTAGQNYASSYLQPQPPPRPQPRPYMYDRPPHRNPSYVPPPPPPSSSLLSPPLTSRSAQSVRSMATFSSSSVVSSRFEYGDDYEYSESSSRLDHDGDDASVAYSNSLLGEDLYLDLEGDGAGDIAGGTCSSRRILSFGRTSSGN